MITGSGTNTLPHLLNNLDNISSASQAVVLQFALATKNSIERKLQEKLQSKAAHFSVEVAGTGGMSVDIIISSKDEVGNYLFYGTQSHSITSSTPMPIGSGFAYKVNHPGTKPIAGTIEQAVRESLNESQALFGGLARGILQ